MTFIMMFVNVILNKSHLVFVFYFKKFTSRSARKRLISLFLLHQATA